MSARGELIDVLMLARTALDQLENDFAWSSWADRRAALAELDIHINALKEGLNIDPLDLRVLFAATGDICEVSLSSGWSDGYLKLSEQFDTALERFLESAS